MSTPRVTARDSKSESRMGATVRRGPRYRSVQRPVSYPVRSLDERLADDLGCSKRHVRRLRYQYPDEIAALCRRLRELGEVAAVAAIQQKIEEACASTMTAEEVEAILAEEAAECELDLAEKRYALTRSDEDRKRVLQLSAREIRLQTDRDAVLRAQGRT